METLLKLKQNCELCNEDFVPKKVIYRKLREIDEQKLSKTNKNRKIMWNQTLIYPLQRFYVKSLWIKNLLKFFVIHKNDMSQNLKHYQFGEKLGSGTYGDVYKASKRSGAREVVAIKCLQKTKMSKNEADAIVAEISILKKLKHDFIVEMLDFQWDSKQIYIIMEYCGGGDLSKYIKKHVKLPEKICKRFLQQLGSALKFLRSKDIAHMDLKPQNILITTNHPQIAGMYVCLSYSVEKQEICSYLKKKFVKAM